mgnify:CR=1 FL=1
MRGEHAMTQSPPISSLGSPPHARGALIDGINSIRITGITPACAGSTQAAAPDSFLFRDHPRMRGEHAAMNAYFDIHEGSPPHARGAPDDATFRRGTSRITPACAGST